jgi:membrane-associated phospholipid phosphatase/predicted MFS family arabinose efflux permease
MSAVAWTLSMERPRRVRVPFIVAFAAAAVAAGLGRAVTTTYLPLLLDRIADAPGLIGMVMLVNAAAGMTVPLVTGIWSDRLGRQGRGRRLPFIVGGTALTAGGLAAVALGSSTSYLVLALTGAAVYTGLNAVTTAHRSLVPEIFGPEGRARATSAQELGMLAGGLVGLAVGGLLSGLALWAPFALAAVVVPLLTWPTVLRTREPKAIAPATSSEGRAFRYYLRAASRPGVRGLLAAQILWVLGYAALPVFFLLYAKEELGLTPAVASLWLAGFGLSTGATIAAAGRVRNPALHRPLLLLGVAMMGGGFLAVSASSDLVFVGGAMLSAGIGFGLVSTLGFPLYSSFIPEGEAGGYTALYFSVRSISTAIALPAAGWTVDLTGSYRSLFVLGGAATLAALLPLVDLRAIRHTRLALGLLATVPALGLLVAYTELHHVDKVLFRPINDVGPGHDLIWRALDPHLRNYLLLLGLAVAAALLTRRGTLGVLGRVAGGGLLAWGLLDVVHFVYDRPRPEEVFAPGEISLNGHHWAQLNSFPSGHMAITAGLGVGIALAFPKLRTVMWAYVALVAFTRVMFGAHFPLDVVAGTAMGAGSALLAAAYFDRRAVRRARTGKPVELGRKDVFAVMPSHGDVPALAHVHAVLSHVAGLVIVDDGSEPAVARRLDAIAAENGAELVRLPQQRGKGSAVRAGLDHLAGRTDAVLVIDADGQHPAAAIPGFIAAARGAELVIGDRFGDLAAMPRHRRVANRFTRLLFQLVTGRRVRDTQNGMRLLRGPAVASFPAGRYEAETKHLKWALRDGLSVAWVPMPTIYGEESSSFRSGRDSVRVIWALLASGARPGPSRDRLPLPAGSPQARPSRSALPGIPARPRSSRPAAAAAS